MSSGRASGNARFSPRVILIAACSTSSMLWTLQTYGKGFNAMPTSGKPDRCGLGITRVVDRNKGQK